jgi:hypothetical protein
VRALASVLLLVLGACQEKLTTPDASDGPPAVLNQIADRCGMPRSVWKLEGCDQVTIKLPPNSEYERVDCLLNEFHKAKLPLRLGFLGNEQPFWERL